MKTLLTFILLTTSHVVSMPVRNDRAINTSPCGFSKAGVYGSSAQGAIVGGSNAKNGQYPWMLSLLYLGYYHTCGATIIDDYWAMTAAHCFQSSSSPSYFMVRAGTYDLSQYDSNTKDYSVSKIILHEKYNSATIKNDIALIKTSKPFNFTSLYQNRVCIPTVTSYNVDGKTAKIVGWGDTKNLSGSSMSSIMQHADITIQTSSTCVSYWGNNMYSHDSQLCAKSSTTSICVGDSGGPIMVADSTTGAYVQVGISSFVSSSGCLTSYPNVFTRVSYFYSWITSTIAKN